MSTVATRPSTPRVSFAQVDDFEEGRQLSPAETQTAWMAFGVLVAALTSGYFNMLEFTSTYWSKDMYSHGWIVPLVAIYVFMVRSKANIDLSVLEKAIAKRSVDLGKILSSKAMTAGAAIVALCVGLNILNATTDRVVSQNVPYFDYWFPHIEIWLAAGMFAYAMRKAPLYEVPPLERWIGVAILAASLGGRVWASVYDINLFDRLSYLTALLGAVLIVGGLSMLKWAWPAILFLLFMFPFPYFIENTVLMWLQTKATVLSTWTLQLLGVSASRMGNRIDVDSLTMPLQVAEACSGLRMLTIFGAMCVLVFFMIERPWWDRLVILLSIIPIAMVSNVIRIVTTALLYIAFGQENETVNHIVHDWAGFAMMPIGLGLLWLELAILSRLTIPVEEEFGGFAGARG